MKTRGYRLWQTWQQMHYPVRGLPEDDNARSALIAIDGIAGPVLERQFSARLRGDGLSPEARRALERCHLDLDRLRTTLSSGASRYFSRLGQLIGIALSGEEIGSPSSPRRC